MTAPDPSVWVQPLYARERADGFLEFLQGIRGGKEPGVIADTDDFIDLYATTRRDGTYRMGVAEDGYMRIPER